MTGYLTIVYHAFISYSHTADKELAPVLQRALERLGTPWWRRSPVRLFRDDSNLAASPALWPGIEAALKECERFVLLASPVAALSYWVDREVTWWLTHRARDRLLIVVTAGDIAYDRRGGDFDWERTNCLPPALTGVFSTEPYWTDLRFAAHAERLSMRHPRFRSAALGIAAAIRGLRKDELESVDIRQYRRSVRMALGGAGTIGVLALATSVAVWVAGEESANARSNRLESESRRLAAEALAELDGGKGIEGATVKAAVAWRIAQTDDARRALARIDETTSDVARVLGQHTSMPRKLVFSPDAQRLATVGNEGVVLQWSVKNGQPVGTPMAAERQWVSQIAYSRNGAFLLLRGRREGSTETPAVAVFRVADGQRMATDAILEALQRGTQKGPVTAAALSPSGARVGASAGNAIAVLPAGGKLSIHTVPGGATVNAMQFADESHLLFVAGKYGERVRIGRLDLDSGVMSLGPPGAGSAGRWDYVAFSDDTRRVAIWGSGVDGLALWQIDDRLALRSLPLPEPRPRLPELTGHHAPALDRGGKIAFGAGGMMSVWDADTRRLLKTRKFQDSHGPSLALSADGRLVAALDGGTPLVWRLDENEQARPIEATRCAARGLEDACLQRLCERLTPPADDKRWRDLLGEGYGALAASLNGTSCASPSAR